MSMISSKEFWKRSIQQQCFHPATQEQHAFSSAHTGTCTRSLNTVPDVGVVSRPLSKAGRAALAFVRLLPCVRSYVDRQATLGADDLVAVRAHLRLLLLLVHPPDMVADVLLALKPLGT